MVPAMGRQKGPGLVQLRVQQKESHLVPVTVPPMAPQKDCRKVQRMAQSTVLEMVSRLVLVMVQWKALQKGSEKAQL